MMVMPDPLKEAADLAKADQDIAAGEQRLAEQNVRIREMEQRGEDTVESRKVRRNYEEVLEAFRNHRQLIVNALKRM